MVIGTFLNPFCVPLDSSNLVPTHPINDTREVLHEFEGVFLLEEVPLILAPLHKVDRIDNDVASFQVREAREGQVQEMVQNVAYQMLPTRVGIQGWVLRHPVSIRVSLILLVTLSTPTSCLSPRGPVPGLRPMLNPRGASGLLANLR